MEKFHSFSITHKGSKHEDDVPCQDASANHPDNPDTAAIAIVADGHGSSRCFRSDIGSKKAVDIAKNCVAAFVKDTPNLPVEMTTQIIDRREVEMSEGKIALGNLVKTIIDKWFAAVMKDEEEHPLKDDRRLEGIVQKYKDRYINDVDYRCHAYGTTLMAAVMSETYWFGFHVGDGKCVVLYEDGSWGLPIPWDDNCTFNITTSICDDDSLSGFRYWFGFNNANGAYTEYGYGVNGQGKDYVREIKSRPLAIFIGSDGVEDSYPRVDNDKYVINFYRNRIVSLAQSGFNTFNEEISGLAKRFADRESTDDVSIAGIVGDFAGKSEMIAKMKQESEVHEKGVLASVKRRDADEKKDAFNAVQKRTDAVAANQRQLENRIATVESELTSLDSKKRSYESALSESGAEIAASDRYMMDCQSKLIGLERDKSECARNEQIISAKIIIADDDYRKSKKIFESAEKEYTKKEDSLRKKQDAYNKYLHKLSTGKPQVLAVEQFHKIVTQTTITAVTYDTYDATGKIPNQITIQLPPANPAAQTPATASGVITDAKSAGLKHEIEKINAELQAIQAQTVAARQNAEAKNRELATLRQQLFDAQQRPRQLESEIKRATQDLRTVEIQNRNQRDAVRQVHNNIAETESNIRAKKTEIDKLKGELEPLKEQSRKQTDTLSIIKAAWEKAEAEAKALEASIQDNK